MSKILYHRIRIARTQAQIGDRIRAAHRWWARLVGLLATPQLAPGEGLWLRPCRSIHTLGMRYAIDVVFLDAHHQVLKAVSCLRPLRGCSARRGTRSVLELPAGTLDTMDLKVGDRLRIEPAIDATPAATE